MAYFTLFRSNKNYHYYWNLRAPNHEVIAQSEGYNSKQGAMNGINAVKKYANASGVHDQT